MTPPGHGVIVNNYLDLEEQLLYSVYAVSKLILLSLGLVDLGGNGKRVNFHILSFADFLTFCFRTSGFFEHNPVWCRLFLALFCGGLALFCHLLLEVVSSFLATLVFIKAPDTALDVTWGGKLCCIGNTKR